MPASDGARHSRCRPVGRRARRPAAPPPRSATRADTMDHGSRHVLGRDAGSRRACRPATGPLRSRREIAVAIPAAPAWASGSGCGRTRSIRAGSPPAARSGSPDSPMNRAMGRADAASRSHGRASAASTARARRRKRDRARAGRSLPPPAMAAPIWPLRRRPARRARFAGAGSRPPVPRARSGPASAAVRRGPATRPPASSPISVQGHAPQCIPVIESAGVCAWGWGRGSTQRKAPGCQSDASGWLSCNG